MMAWGLGGHTFTGGIFKVQRLIRVHNGVNGVSGHGGFAKPLQNQLELAGIGGHIAYGKHARQAGFTA